MTKRYPAIEDLAIVGNGRTAAIVDREGSIVWCCWPRFDSPAQFCQLLDNESKHFIDWLEQLPIEEEGELRIVYAIDGGNTPKERTLDHLGGYRDSGPVHVGNGAGEQTQIDIFGHVIDATVLCYELSEQIDEGAETLLGNFPQGFSHLGLIRAALYLEPIPKPCEEKGTGTFCSEDSAK